LTLSHMKLSTFKAIITGQSMIRHIKICGEFGDPVMNPHLKDMIDYAMTTTKVTMMINTNGGLRNTSWYKKLAAAYGKRIVIVFGIDGLDHETNWKYREGVEFDKAYNNMLTFYRNGGRVKWQFILFEWNVHQIEDAKKQADALGITMIFIVDHFYSASMSDLEIDDIRERLKKIGVEYRKF